MIVNFNFSQPQWILGLMSGTSLDGIDAALLKTDGTKITEYGACDFLPYTKDFQSKLSSVFGKETADDTLVYEFTNYHIEIAQKLINKSSVIPAAIGFHGQTIFHQPKIDHKKAKTVQIGNPQLMASILNIPVVFNFRQNDIDHDGEGAPLVPLFHQAMMNGDNSAVINIGGVANITILKNNTISSGDVGPGCALINDWIQRHTNWLYDIGGEHAMHGQVNEPMVSKWLTHDFFNKPFPKSLDRNTFKFVLNDIENFGLSDGAATLASFTVRAILHHTKNIEKLILCGGGRHNQYMVNNLAVCHTIQNIDDLAINGDFVEAYAFAYLAARSIQKMPLSLPSTTGVKVPVSGGVLYMPAYR